MSEIPTPTPASLAQSSYRRILSATSVLGSAAAVNVLIGMVRSKVVAEFLGKEGFGEMGMYMSVSGLAAGLATFGLNLSGVRELADALGSGDKTKVQVSRLTLRKLSWGLGLLGSLVMALGAYPISLKTFGTPDHQAEIAWLSITVLLSLLGNYWMALVQVSGQMTRMGKIQVVGAIAGAAISVACFVVLRKRGIVPALVLAAVTQMLVTAYWARGLSLPVPEAQTRYSPESARRLLTMGGVSVAVGIQSSLVGLLLRKLVLDGHGLDGVGTFQAAQGLSAMYATYILGAMSADFLPRLTATMHDRVQANRVINDQTVIALLLGLPGVLATIVFAPWVIPFFYSSQFSETVPVLQVMAVGVFGRLLAWPLGMALMAVNAKRKWIAGEVVCNAVQLAVAWALLPSLGVMATSVATIAVSLVCSVLYYAWVKRLTGLQWSREVYSALWIGSSMILFVLGLAYALPMPQATMAGAVVCLTAGWYSLRQIVSAAGVTRGGLVTRIASIWTSFQKSMRIADGPKA